jgi:hypothetical protein
MLDEATASCDARTGALKHSPIAVDVEVILTKPCIFFYR